MDLYSEESERMLMDEDMFSFQSIWSVLATSYPWIAIFLKMYLQNEFLGVHFCGSKDSKQEVQTFISEVRKLINVSIKSLANKRNSFISHISR